MPSAYLSVAIVGAGPAGFYAAGQLLDQHDVEVKVDLIDRLPTPHGLVRAGVAPDHPEKKLVVDRMFDFYLSHPNIRFFGNVELGSHVSHEDLQERYDAVIYAVGASSDARLGIPGEDLMGSHSAREFVSWYNGHPDFKNRSFDFSTERAVIIGNGNVALDVARILTLPPEKLGQTDIADHAIDALSKSKIKEVVILGRRGHVHAAFNNPEIEEFEHLDGVDVVVENADFTEEAANMDWVTRRKVKTIERLSKRPQKGGDKRIILRFLTSPSEILGEGEVRQLKTVSNSKGQSETLLETGLVLRSVGYRGSPLPGIPFDENKKIIPNEDGRVLDGSCPLPSTYVTGWIKRGPRGVIGTNKKCARDTVQCLLEDAERGLLSARTVPNETIEDLLQENGHDLVSEENWNRIDRLERLAGRDQGRPRVKLTSWDELLTAAQS